MLSHVLRRNRRPFRGVRGRGAPGPAPRGHHYDGPMSRRRRTLFQRVREHIGFSVIAIGVLFVLLRLLGLRSTFAGFVLSVGITLALNVALSYYSDYRAKHPRPQRPSERGGGDIRFREEEREERRYDPRDLGPRSPRDDRDEHRRDENR